MSKFIFCIFSLVLSYSHAATDPVAELARTKATEYKDASNMVIVMFKAKADVDAALGNIKAAMRTRDVNSFINPYWIVSFDGEAVSEKTNCGVIIARWYQDGYPYRQPWQDIMDSAFRENAQSGTYLFASNGGFRMIESEEAKGEALKKICVDKAEAGLQKKTKK